MTACMEVVVEARVGFPDCDPMGMLWHGRYARYFELARVALMTQLDYSYEQMAASGYAWPVLDYRVRYLKPLRSGQRLRIRVRIVEWQFRLKLHYRIEDPDSGAILTRGETVQAAVQVATGEMQMASPPVLRERLQC